jgi:hypothetical protein
LAMIWFSSKFTMLIGTIASICNYVMTIQHIKNAARGGMLNRREPPQ